MRPRAPLALSLLAFSGFVAAACSNEIDRVQGGSSSASSGGGASASSSVASTSASASSSGASSTASSTGSGGGGGVAPAGPLAPANCSPLESALVSATDADGTHAARFDGTGWNAIDAGGSGTTTATALDGPTQHAWIAWNTASGVDLAWAVDETSFAPPSPSGWTIDASSRLVAPSPSLLLGWSNQEVQVAVVNVSTSTLGFYGATLEVGDARFDAAPLGSYTVIAFVDPEGDLCDAMYDGSGWSESHCRSDVKVPSGGEIPLAGPRVVAFENGDVAIVFYVVGGESIGATVRHADVWSPVATFEGDVGVDFAATPTASGDALVAFASDLGLVTVRLSTGGSFSDARLVVPTTVQAIAAAKGICGDDALIAYAAADGLHAARVQGDDAATILLPISASPSRDGLAIATANAPNLGKEPH